jgi:hypothetical protein
MGMPPVGSPLEEYDAFYKKYGRTPLHPKTVKDMLNCEGETNGLVCSVVSLGNPDHPEIDKFFDSIDQLLAWKPKLDKTNGEETDFARQGRATMALLKKYLPVALARLLALDARMKDRIKVA